MFVIPTDTKGAVLRPAFMDIIAKRVTEAKRKPHPIPTVTMQNKIPKQVSNQPVSVNPKHSPPRIAKILDKTRYSIQNLLN
ncbi:hypothetical protein TVAG_019390 [Trichomonas vaginalis G3]|uniref:Uncharacterized protein n=1 Tax=Trichomonas vaginalis (strain ATCC PRA-98 / G3) TaxID=412133 RepID=A2DX12_TRIV3|nr:hypothetical protein TVAGG3_0185030 [Trichomonas vaginalis G3]EAY15039.1 hypothetical protein TVAG_019390 [Trichomonas vaginalis G3]KAI5549580.1 hypothetical protein TVAGG3_0185030 [Trichomonas vaginalis G3]|eukprot:XP_001327262.1 hypothetical protein [Trichomonas vaginalis G3]